jgi:hypothetical protein
VCQEPAPVGWAAGQAQEPCWSRLGARLPVGTRSSRGVGAVRYRGLDFFYYVHIERNKVEVFCIRRRIKEKLRKMKILYAKQFRMILR